ncbi:zinc finger protein RFP-like [Elgaria multicarinata webbii]|uniref:zinc finger protein RFP-like n=1 Tax=Elgaria multicarinata webbii TaxID=159646 RepID=UPI002FCD3ECB
MATGGPITEFCEEATCSICLEYFKQPVTIDCGHNFCQACLTQYWRESDTDSSCPQCRETVQQRNFRPNWQLANLVELVKKLQEEKKEEGKRGVCERHQEPLKLFCKNDQDPICVVCDRSKEHRDHSVFPMEEACQEYKEKIQAQIKSLEKEREKFVDWKLTEEKGRQRCLIQLEEEKKKIRSAFERMQKFLEEKKCFWLTLLDDLEKKIEKRQEENDARLSEEISSLNKLIREMESKLQQPASEFLQDIRSTLNRYEKAQGRQPIEFPPGLEETLRICAQKNSALEKAIENCEESLKQALHKVNVTLYPDTAHPNLILSEDLKSVQWGDRRQDLPNNPERFDKEPCVLGRERFTSGRHWWEVEVEGEWAEWAVGVARASVKRKAEISLNPSEGFWALQKTMIDTLGSFSDWQLSALTYPKLTLVYSRSELRKIRVSLDYEEGCVEFFDADTNHLIFAFPSASFSGEKICPFFYLKWGGKLKC